jgi:hypothetical protein
VTYQNNKVLSINWFFVTIIDLSNYSYFYKINLNCLEYI